MTHHATSQWQWPVLRLSAALGTVWLVADRHRTAAGPGSGPKLGPCLKA